MKYELYKCNWCGREHKKQLNDPQPSKPNSPEDLANYTEREGMMPIVTLTGQDEKKFHPVTARLHFCSNECNQTYKRMEVEAQEAADAAWITVYNRRKDA